MKSVNNFIIKASKTHKEKDGEILLIEKFENQSKVIQYHKIESVPRQYKGVINKGDLLVVHFNILSYSLKENSTKVNSKFYLYDDFYYVPLDIAHAVIKASGDVITLGDWNIITPIKESTEKTLSSGIIIPDLRSETEIKDSLMKGYVEVSNNEELSVGDKVLLNKYSDYEVEFPGGKKYWLVRNLNILAKING